MRSQRARLVAASAIALVAVGSLVGLVTTSLALGVDVRPDDIVGLGGGFAAFGLVGAVIVARVPGNRLGWVFGAIGVVLPFAAVQDMARAALEAGVAQEIVALGQVAADVSWVTAMFLILVLVPSWYPDGQPITRRWGWFAVAAAVAWAVQVGMATLSPEKQILLDYERDVWLEVVNPIGIVGVPDVENSMIAGVCLTAILLAGALAVVSLIVRYRRSGQVARLQIRWLMASFLLLGPVLALGPFQKGPWGDVFDVAFSAAFLAVPVSAGVAITRYRLYELGRLVRRTMTYAIVIGGLALLFAVGAVWLPQQFGLGDNSLAVAASTLVVAALFNPLRRRVQRVVDRRFHRTRYDAEAVLADMRTRLRDQVDVARVGESLVAVSTGALEPETSALWIRSRL